MNKEQIQQLQAVVEVLAKQAGIVGGIVREVLKVVDESEIDALREALYYIEVAWDTLNEVLV